MASDEVSGRRPSQAATQDRLSAVHSLALAFLSTCRGPGAAGPGGSLGQAQTDSHLMARQWERGRWFCWTPGPPPAN